MYNLAAVYNARQNTILTRSRYDCMHVYMQIQCVIFYRCYTRYYDIIFISF
jgi:hypothetical protein